MLDKEKLWIMKDGGYRRWRLKMADIERCGIQKNGGKKRWRIKKKAG